MNNPQEPQDRFAGDPAPGTRDTGSDVPSGGEDRPSGAYQGDESVPAHGGGDAPEFETRGFTNEPPRDVEPATPPYEGRQTEAKSGSASTGDANTGGATAPTTDSEYKSPAPGSTAGGATASPAVSSLPHGARNPIPAMMSRAARTGGAHSAEDRR